LDSTDFCNGKVGTWACRGGGHVSATAASKTKQDRPIATMRHQHELGITDSLAKFRLFPRRPHLEDILVLNAKRANTNTASCSTMASVQRCCQPSRPSSHCQCCQCQMLQMECGVQNLVFTTSQASSIVLTTPKSNSRWTSFFLVRETLVEGI